MIKLKQTTQHVRCGRGAVRRRNDVDFDAREPEEIEILFRCEGVVARHDKQATVPQAGSVPGKRAEQARGESHSGRSVFASRLSRLPKNGTAPKRPCRKST